MTVKVLCLEDVSLYPMKRGTPYSYKSHYWCHICGWVEQDKCISTEIGFICPICGGSIRTRARYKHSAEKKRRGLERLANNK